MVSTGRLLFAIGGAISAAIAMAHLIVIAIGAVAYRFFGAGDTLARQAEAGARSPAVVTFTFALVFVAFALYGFSAAAVIRRLPMLRPMLVAIAAVYLLRGLAAFPQGFAFVVRPSTMPFQYFLASFVSLVAGVCYAMGARVTWEWLGETEADSESEIDNL
jgi:hypothetical protein